jgi:hypothetical protein
LDAAGVECAATLWRARKEGSGRTSHIDVEAAPSHPIASPQTFALSDRRAAWGVIMAQVRHDGGVSFASFEKTHAMKQQSL